MLGAATCCFINTEPGALWELFACPLSALAVRCKSVLCVCSLCVFAGHRGRSYFMGASLNASRLCICWFGCACINMCVFMSWRACGSRGIRSQASPKGVRGPVTSKGCRVHYAKQTPKGEILFVWRGLAWQYWWLTLQPGTCTDCHHPGRFKSWTTMWRHISARGKKMSELERIQFWKRFSPLIEVELSKGKKREMQELFSWKYQV